MKIILLLVLSTLPLLAQTEADALAFLQKHQPTIHAKVAGLKSTDASDYDSAISEAKQAVQSYARITSAGDTVAAAAYLKMYALDFEAISLSDAYLATKDESDRNSLKAKLQQVITASFDQWTIVERARVRRLEAELAKAKAELEAAVADRDLVILSDTDSIIEESRAYQAAKKK